MRAFPPASDLQFLVGREIAQICLDPWSVQFRFHPVGQITVEGGFEHLSANGVVHPHSVADRDAAPLHLYELMQQAITRVEAQPAWLSLTFSNGAKLNIRAELDQRYESGQIYPTDDGQNCIVF